ncbi:MAG: patatin-like phospholipase family protein, partial [Candidatus Binatia bacterium]
RAGGAPAWIPVSDERNQTKRVFILGGGAALGAHQIGALRFLEEQGIRPDAIIGSSIGVINACLYATGGVELMERAWAKARSVPGIARVSLRQNPLFGYSFFDVGPTLEMIDDFVDYEKILHDRIELAFILLNLSRGTGEIHSNRDCKTSDELRQVVRAGYALPLLFPPVRFRGDWFVDGGFAWNVPFEHAFELRASEIYILAVIASRLPYRKEFGNIFGFAKRFLDVMWRTIGNMGYLYARLEQGRYQGVPVVVVEPGEEFSGFSVLDVFNAYPRKTRRLRDAGYRDAKRTFARLARQGLLPPSVQPRMRATVTPLRRAQAASEPE